MWLYYVCILYLVLKPVRTGEIIFGYNHYTEFQVGNMSLIISVLHGGTLKPGKIPDRDAGCWDLNTLSCIFTHDCPPGSIQDHQKCSVVTKEDKNTIEVAQTLAKEIRRLNGNFFPYLVINHLHRIKMDANREKEEATFGIPQAEKAWGDFMRFMRSAKSQMKGGLIIDIHGQTHCEQWIELGYTLSKASLNSGKIFAASSSIRHLANELRNVSFETLLRGSRSLCKFIEAQNNKCYLCVPSPTNPKPKTGSYYEGGYITKTFGSRYSGTVDAIQIELPQWVRDIKEYPKFCKALARAIIHFWKTNYCSQKNHMLLGC